MKAMPSTGNPDKDFAALIKIHHMGAVDMAGLELSSGMDTQLKGMAKKMIDAQQKEIAEFNTIISAQRTKGGVMLFIRK